MSWIDSAVETFDYDMFRARLRGAYRDAGYSDLEELCRDADLLPADVRSMIDRCELDFRPYISVIERLAGPLNRTAEYLITGKGGDHPGFGSVREKTHLLVDAYTYKKDLAPDECARLHNYAELKLDQVSAQTRTGIYRCGVPQNVVEVGHLFEEMTQFQG